MMKMVVFKKNKKQKKRSKTKFKKKFEVMQNLIKMVNHCLKQLKKQQQGNKQVNMVNRRKTKQYYTVNFQLQVMNKVYRKIKNQYHLLKAKVIFYKYLIFKKTLLNLHMIIPKYYKGN